jgi:hypothetical protein
MEKVYNTDVSLTQYTDYIIDRVTSCIKESMSAAYEPFEKAIRAQRYLRNLFLSPFGTPDIDKEALREQLQEIMLIYERVHESLIIIDDSLLLALSGRYTTAFSSLRGAIECVIVGGFYHSLLDENRLQSIQEEYRPSGWSENERDFWTFIRDLITNHQDVANNGIIFEMLIERTLDELKRRPPGFYKMLRMLEKWYESDILQETAEIISSYLYPNLSRYAHTMSDATTYIQHVKKEDLIFNSGVVSEDMISKFVEMFHNVLDNIGAIYLIIAKEFYRIPDSRTAILAYESELYKHGKDLTQTRRALAFVLGLRRDDE